MDWVVCDVSRHWVLWVFRLTVWLGVFQYTVWLVYFCELSGLEKFHELGGLEFSVDQCIGCLNGLSGVGCFNGLGALWVFI